MSDKIRVGLIGLSADRGWVATAHYPALEAIPAFEIVACATTRQETADASAEKFGIPRAFGDWREMVAQDDIDLVIVGVKVPYHRELTLGAIAAGKHVFCEWPLGLNSAEAAEMANAAEKAGIVNMVGLQSRSNPQINFLRELVRQRRIGDVISATMVISLASWGPKTPAAAAYRTDINFAATALTVPTGHSLDAFCHCLGPFKALSSVVTTQHKQTELVGTGRIVPVTSPDQVLIIGELESGAVASVHVKADMFAPLGVRFEINGTEGDIIATSRPPVGKLPRGVQRAELIIAIADAGGPFREIEVPAAYDRAPADTPKGPPFYHANLLVRLADGIRSGVSVDPDFAAALVHHRLLDAVQKASDTGQRQTVRA